MAIIRSIFQNVGQNNEQSVNIVIGISIGLSISHKITFSAIQLITLFSDSIVFNEKRKTMNNTDECHADKSNRNSDLSMPDKTAGCRTFRLSVYA